MFRGALLRDKKKATYTYATVSDNICKTFSKIGRWEYFTTMAFHQ